MKTKIRKQLSSKKLKEIRFLFCPTKNKNKGWFESILYKRQWGNKNEKTKKLRQGNKTKIVEFDRFLKDMNKQKSSTSRRETKKKKLLHYV